MKSIWSFLFLSALIVGICACSGGGGKTSAQLRITGGLVTGNYTGMLVGRHSSGKRVAKKFLGSETEVTLDLANGTWEFAAISWDTSSDPDAFEGTTKCYYGTRTLTGQAVTLDAAMTSATCAEAVFGGAAAVDGPNGFKRLSFHNCSDLSSVVSHTTGCPNLARGFHRSFRLSLAEYNEFTNSPKTSAYESGCYSNTEVETVTNTNLRLPIGDESGLFALVVQSFANADCSNLSETSFVSKGLQDPDSILYEDVGAINYIYFEDTRGNFLTRLSSITGTGTDPQPKPLVKLSATSPATYVYFQGDYEAKLLASNLEPNEGAQIFTAPTNPSYVADSLTQIGNTAFLVANAATAAGNVRDIFSYDGVLPPTPVNLTNVPETGASPPYGVVSSKIFATSSQIYFIKAVDEVGTKKQYACVYTPSNNTTDCPHGPVDDLSLTPIGTFNEKFYFLADESGDLKLKELASTTVTERFDFSTLSSPTLRYQIVQGANYYFFFDAAGVTRLVRVTPAGTATILHTDFPGFFPSPAYPFKGASGSLWFVVNNGGTGQAPASIDGSGTFSIVNTSFANANDTKILGELAGDLLFTSDADGASGSFNTDIYSFNGSAVSPIVNHAGPIQLFPTNFSRNYLLTDNALFFTGNHTEGLEPWAYRSGSPSLVHDIESGAGGSDPKYYTHHNGKVFFSASEASGGRELWQTDEIPAGATRVADLIPSTPDSNPKNLRSVGAFLYFFSKDASSGADDVLYRTDGTPAGTVRQFDFLSSGFSSLWFAWEDRVHLQMKGPSFTDVVHHHIFRP